MPEVQQTALWAELEDSLAKERKLAQASYKQMLDEQIEHKAMLALQGNMT